MNSKNNKDIEGLNQVQRPFPSIAVGDRVWVKRPEGSGTKLATRWIVPGLVVDQMEEHSYKVEIGKKSVSRSTNPVFESIMGRSRIRTRNPLFWYKGTEDY